MPGINPAIICRRVAINPGIKTVKQKPRKMNEERSQALCDEVDQLLRAGFIRETFYPNWLTDSAKKNDKWRVCIDFTNLNEACPKDNFPLLKIAHLVEATVGNELFNFMDSIRVTTRLKCTRQMRT